MLGNKYFLLLFFFFCFSNFQPRAIPLPHKNPVQSLNWRSLALKESSRFYGGYSRSRLLTVCGSFKLTIFENIKIADRK